MTEDETSTAPTESWLAYKPDGSAREVFALTIVWSLAEPHRVGEVALLPKDGVKRLFGRGGGKPADAIERATFFRQRPGKLEPQAPLRGQGISRRQLVLIAHGDELIAERVGRCPMIFNGIVMDRVVARPGDTIMLKNELILLCGQRPLMMMDLEREEREVTSRFSSSKVPFGGPDEHGIVGESPEAWELRGQLPFLARRSGHVLVQGPSGAGKELVSRALHQLSARGGRPIVARNAATFPSGLIDAELFGNIKDYPNAGMRERRGLIGEADGSTLFLDEIGELPAEMQAHLLRVLDSEGSYQRLGEDRPQRADIRLVAATNRDPEQLRPDFLARLTLRIALPGLNERREDIPILARHLLRKAASQDPDLGHRLFKGGDSVSGEPRIDPHLMNLLVRHNYSQHVRELESFLWRAMTGSRGRHLALTDELSATLSPKTVDDTTSTVLTPEVIQASLERHGGNRTKVYKELGLKNRHVLYRLIKKHGLDGEADEQECEESSEMDTDD
jgi:two-component system nitrogen regulation response regulator GlnG/two-component system response regulator HydG